MDRAPEPVWFRVGGTEIQGLLHRPAGDAVGGAVVLGGLEASDDARVVAACEALAEAEVGALRFTYRRDHSGRTTLDWALADVGNAMRLLKTHPTLRERLAVVGCGWGAMLAAVAAGRDSRVRAAVLVGPPVRVESDPRWRPIAELSRTRARVLLIRGANDTTVSTEDISRYATVLSQARVTNRVITIADADHGFSSAAARARMARAAADWVRESL